MIYSGKTLNQLTSKQSVATLKSILESFRARVQKSSTQNWKLNCHAQNSISDVLLKSCNDTVGMGRSLRSKESAICRFAYLLLGDALGETDYSPVCDTNSVKSKSDVIRAVDKAIALTNSAIEVVERAETARLMREQKTRRLKLVN